MRFIAVAALLALAGTPVLSQNKDQKPSWDVSNPPYPYKEYSFTTNEGTWMNLDVSPDGSTIVFDLLGDIYSMPISGGQAKALRTGIPFEVQPRFSPDGKRISFTSDAGGGDNIWVMNTDGSEARQVTKEDFRLLNNAVWTSDGNYIIARKHFTSSRSLGAGELWMYHLSGGEGIQLNKRKNDQQDLGEPDASPDGKYVYYSEDMYPGGYFQYNKDPNSQIYVIKRYDLKTGEIKTITGGPGGAVRPQVSPDGKTLAFVKRVRSKTVLFLRDLASGEEWPVFDKLSKDQQEAWAIFGVYPNFKWLPDNRNIVIWAGGKIVKVNTADYTATDIPFTVDCRIKMADALHFEHKAAPDSFTVHAIRHAITSPDGKMLVFNAAGYLWKKALPDGIPVRLTVGKSFEFEPAFSPDGKQIAFVTWSDTSGGTIVTMPAAGGKAVIKKITREKGIYRTPSFSPDSKKLVYLKDGGNDHQGFSHCVETGIFVANLSGNTIEKISDDGLNPTFSADGTRIFYFDYEGDKRNLKSMDLTGHDARTHFTSKYATQVVPSPDNKWVAFSEFFKIYIAPFPPAGAVTDLSSGMKAMPVARVTRDAGNSLHWSADSKKIMWTSGDQYYSSELKNRFSFLPDAPDSLPALDSTGTAIGLVLPSDKPTGKLALKGARIITMDKDMTVIEKGTILIDSNRIIAVGPESSVNIPSGTKVIDVTGKTIMPGIVDVHAHLGTFRQGLSPQQQWSYYANLAYGVTTTHDPSSNSEMVFSQSEMVKAGNMVGPRIFSTGWILYGADGDFKAVINSLEDAVSAVKRTADWGAFSVKSYNQPRRDQRQQVIEASRRQQVMVVPEGGSFFFHNLSMIMDGHTGIEHNLPIAPLHKDVLNLWSFSKTGITPTLIVSYGSVTGEYYFYQKDSVWSNKKLLNFTPRAVIDSRSRHVTAIPEEEYENGHILISRSLKALMDRGVKVNLGSHGQLQGLGAHWELWMLQQGGMTNMQALQCATINGAYYIGMEKELGSLENGKLADLVILERNPLDNIRNSESVQYTMVNGRIYDAATMNETGNYSRQRMPFYFESFRSAPAFDFHMTGHGHGDED